MACECSHCDCGKTIDDLLEFLGLAICYMCKGVGYAYNSECSVCNGNKFNFTNYGSITLLPLKEPE